MNPSQHLFFPCLKTLQHDWLSAYHCMEGSQAKEIPWTSLSAALALIVLLHCWTRGFGQVLDNCGNKALKLALVEIVAIVAMIMLSSGSFGGCSGCCGGGSNYGGDVVSVVVRWPRRRRRRRRWILSLKRAHACNRPQVWIPTLEMYFSGSCQEGSRNYGAYRVGLLSLPS